MPMPRSNETPTHIGLPGSPGCDDVIDHLELYLDGLDGTDGSDEGLPGLTDAERATVEDHLTRCPACAQELGRAQRIRDGLRALPEVPFDLPLAGRETRRPWTRWSVPLATAAVLLLALITGVVWRTSQPATSVPEVSAEEMARAELEARYALARLAEVTRKTQEEITDEVLARHVVAPVQRRLMRSLGMPLDPEPSPEKPSSL